MNVNKFTKRTPLRPHAHKNEMYVSHTSNPKALFKRANKLLDDPNIPLIIIHGLGAAITKAVDLALELEEKRGTSITISTNTSSVVLLDEYIPVQADLNPVPQTRLNSAIHITIKRSTPVSYTHLTLPTTPYV
eukprot:TRINITY_DN8013_c0_g1_i2.p1 TRINITY_DN8013_c0_g1~~TRINITY_DN8013_c0_g1_i2.p1  ORF type:complete len:133 (-),score=8.58 TRINITY_DN8013_c0_g1_i2:5-403(-)